MKAISPTSLETAELTLRLLASRGAPAYFVYLVEPAQIPETLEDIRAEVEAFGKGAGIDVIESSPSATSLLHHLPTMTKDLLLISAEAYTEADWLVLDRRRSSLARGAVTVFVTSPPSFSSLMRVAPNLASWLGGNLFLREDPTARIEGRREHRLSALRSWSGKTDDEVVATASRGSLPRDPEYAEWLTLLGRGDLLDA